MELRCTCGNRIGHFLDQLACIDCGRTCCTACGVSVQAATYCARCARTLLDLPVVRRGGGTG